jgi:hypothetical protein
MAPVLLAAQREKEKWQRVYTGEDSIIEINVSKVTFVEYEDSRRVTFGYNIGRVGFRTSFAKPEALKENPGVKYKRRLETIEFNCAANRYRLYEATLLDEKGKVVKTFGWDPSTEWREIKHGGMMEKLFGPACRLFEEKRRNP